MTTPAPVEQKEEAAATSVVQFLLDGLEVESIAELKMLVDHAKRVAVGSVSLRTALNNLIVGSLSDRELRDLDEAIYNEGIIRGPEYWK